MPKSILDLINGSLRGNSNPIIFSDAQIAAIQNGEWTGPEGPQGPPGVPGAGMVWMGAWSAAILYLEGDGVSRNGSSYIAIADNINSAPPSANWDLIASKGDTGATGATGAQGPQGNPGITLSGNAYDLLRGDGTFSQIVPRGTITTSSPWQLTQTWNASGVAFSGLEINITRTASATNSTYFKTSVVSIGDNFAIAQDGAATHLAKIMVNGNATAIAASADFTLSGANNIVSLSRNDGAANRIFNPRHIVLSGAPGGAMLVTIGGDQYSGLQFASGRQIFWTSSATDSQGTADTGLSRNAAGVLEVNNGTPGTFRNLITKSVRGAAVTVANLPATPVEGMLVAVTDSTTATWGDTITGSGSNHVLAYYNGTNWTVAAK